MSDYIQNLFAERIGGSSFGKGTVLYKFEKIKRARREAEATHPETPIIDMGVGEPDWMADKMVVDRLYAGAQKRENRVMRIMEFPCFRKRPRSTWIPCTA